MSFVDYRRVRKSKREEELGLSLMLRVKAVELKDLRKQDPVIMTKAKIKYVVDFSAYDLKLNQRVYFEMKGFETQVWRLKRRLWKHYGPGRLEVWKKNNSGIYLHEVIEPKLESLSDKQKGRLK